MSGGRDCIPADEAAEVAARSGRVTDAGDVIDRETDTPVCDLGNKQECLFHPVAWASIDRFSKRMSEMTGERGGLSGKERARRLLEQ